MTKVAAYLRVSTKDQDVRLQSESVRQWLKGQGIASAAWFIDKVSGRTMDRPRFKMLQSAILAGNVDTVVMYALDRFARTMVDGLVELDRWKKRGVRIVFVKEQLEISGGNPLGDLFIKCMTAMCLAFAEAERERIISRQKDGIHTARKRQIEAHNLAARGWSVDRIAAHLGRKESTVRLMLAYRKDSLYWGGAQNRLGTRKGDPKQAWDLYTKKMLSHPQIASIMKITTKTVGKYIRQWKEKLEMDERAELEARAKKAETARQAVA